MIPLLVPEIEGGYPERDGGKGEEQEEGLVFEYSSSWMWQLMIGCEKLCYKPGSSNQKQEIFKELQTFLYFSANKHCFFGSAALLRTKNEKYTDYVFWGIKWIQIWGSSHHSI